MFYRFLYYTRINLHMHRELTDILKFVQVLRLRFIVLNYTCLFRSCPFLKLLSCIVSYFMGPRSSLFDVQRIHPLRSLLPHLPFQRCSTWSLWMREEWHGKQDLGRGISSSK